VVRDHDADGGGHRLITPPVGLNVFVTNSLARDVPMIDTFRGVGPSLISDMVRLTLVVAFPIMSLILPKLIDG
jgi:TRAP-type C4-dicarboxylate transport system permease large subunit